LLKYKFPLEFASATLRNSRDDEQTKNILKELTVSGYKYKLHDRHKSEVNWSVKDGELIGGFTMIKGIGPKMAEDMVRRRSMKQIFTPRQEELLTGKKRITTANQLNNYDNLQNRLF
jgi:DNA polymerase III alpha subunit